MTLIDARENLKDFWKEFKKESSGIFGLILLIIFLLLLIFEKILIPFPDAGKNWGNISYWDDNSANAPPVWTNLFSAKKKTETSVLNKSESSIKDIGSMKIYKYTFLYDYKYDLAPNDMIFHINGEGSPNITISIERPDGEKIELLRKQLQINKGIDGRISLDTDAKDNIYSYASMYEEQNYIDSINSMDIKPLDIIFAQKKTGIIKNPEPEKGMYKINISMILKEASSKIENVNVTVSGKVSGFLGTDSSKRDIWSGVVSGLKWAMIIGLLTSFISVAIGVTYGVVCAYFGGMIDSIMQRIFEIFLNIPFLPVLIVMSAVFKPSIWTFIIIMCAFNWTGSVKTVRSMALQIKEETYIEASRAIGANHKRLIFKHIIPLLIPYSFASMALSVPAAIVTEASISLLGLGDASIVTWGKILQDAMSGGAVLNGMWWWVVPPGLSIAIMGMAFSFIGFAMDKILMPKLRTR